MNKYIQDNKDRFVDELISLLEIPSVSTDSSYKDSVLKAAEYIKDKLLSAGIDKAELVPTDGHPVVYGEKIISPELPTILVYGHYDVQPPDPLELWNTPPFEPAIREDRIYARGASDDKGQMYLHIKALETMVKTDSLPCNVKFMIEGEEEVGSDHLPQFLEQHRDKLEADTILISDTGIFSPECPTITTGLRGLAYLQVEVTGPKRDLHSGMFGGAVANPAFELAKIISKLKDEKNRVTVPGFYDDVEEVSEEERQKMSEVPFEPEHYKKELGIKDVDGEEGFTTLERTSIRPTLEVNGMWSGYTGEGAKTVLPSKAYAKISMRLVPFQSSDKIADLFIKHVNNIAPGTVSVEVKKFHGGEPAVTPVDSAGYKAASKAFEEVWGKTPVPLREGGSIPIVNLFEKELGLKSVLMGFGLDEDAIHSPNESFRIHNYLKGIETVVAFYKHFARSEEK